MKNSRHSASGGVFAKGYTTGHTRRNLQQNGVKISDGGLTATVESTTDYAAYVEYGTRKMEAQPYMKPAYEKQKKLFEEDMEKVVEYARMRNPKLEIFPICAKTGEGVDAWCDWLRKNVAQWNKG